MNNTAELIYRFLTASLLIAFAVYAVFYLSPEGFLWGSMGLMLWAGWEWAYISGYTSYKARIGYILWVYLSLVLGCDLSIPIILALSGSIGICAISYMGWLIATQAPLPTRHSRALTAGLGLIGLILCWRSLMILKLRPHLLGIGLLIIGLTDTLAYFAGRHWGKRLLAPNISPKKTWEGFLVSFLSPVIVVELSFKYSVYSKSALLLAGLFTVLASTAGDLLESLAKRQQNVKDSGNLLPGHGGLLDRLDSIIIGIPVFTASLYGLHSLLSK